MQDWGFEEIPEPEEQDCWVFPENWEALNVFIACNTQWRFLSGMGGAVRTGLDYQAVKAVMEVNEIKDKRDCFLRVQVCEKQALDIFNKD